MEENVKKNFLINFSFTVVVGSLFFLICRLILKYLTPFVLATIVAYIMQRPAELVSKKIKIKKEPCAALLALLVYLFITGVILFLIYETVFFISDILSASPHFIDNISHQILSLQNRLNSVFEGLSPDLAENLSDIVGQTVKSVSVRLTEWLSSFAARLAKGTPSFFFSVIVALVASCYIAKDYNRLKKFVTGLLNQKVYKSAVRIKRIFTKSILKIIKGYVILSLITYAELTVGFFILRIKYAPIVALIISIIDLLPVLGAGTVLIPWGIITLLLGNTAKGISILLLYTVTILIRNFIEPKIIGKQMGIHPLFTLLAMFTGLKLAGFWGLLLFPVVLIVTMEYYREELV